MHARRALAEISLFHRSLAHSGESLIGKVRLGFAGASSRPWLPLIARAVREKTPGIDLQLSSLVYGGAGPSHVTSGDLDIVFSRRPTLQRGLQEYVFEYEEVLAAVPSDHRLANRRNIDLSELAEEPWVMFPATKGSTVRDMGLAQAREAGFVPRVVQEAPDSYTILGLVAAGVGVTLTVSSVTHVNTPGATFIPLSGPRRYMAATLLWSNHASQPTQSVIETFKEIAPPPTQPDGFVLE